MKKWSDRTRRIGQRIHGFEDVDDSGVVGVKYSELQRPSLWASAHFPTQSYGGTMTVVRYLRGKINVMLVGARISHYFQAAGGFVF